MTCSNMTTVIPEGCLGKEVITLQCKSPTEVLIYYFSMTNRFASDETITNVSGQPAGNSGVSIQAIEMDKQTFKCKIQGGDLNTDVGIRFIIKTNQDDIMEFDCKLPIRSAGILCSNIILNTSSPAGTINIGNVQQVSSDMPASVINVGTPEAAILDFNIPQGLRSIDYFKGKK